MSVVTLSVPWSRNVTFEISMFYRISLYAAPLSTTFGIHIYILHHKKTKIFTRKCSH